MNEFQSIVKDCLRINFLTCSRSLEVYSLQILRILKASLLLQLIFRATDMSQIAGFDIFQKLSFVLYIQIQI